MEEFRLHELHAFQGITVLKPLMSKKKPIVSNDVCSYTVLGVCVCGCTREIGIHRSRKKKVIMIDEEYTICFRFPREKRYSPLMCRKKERIVGCEGQKFHCML